jgi:uncharacterized membrane protein YphA (DoxX/SURF4 family)
LFTWYLLKGAGPLSLDALIGRGIAPTALPLAGAIIRFFEGLSGWGDPAIKLLLRCRIAALFLRSGVMKINHFELRAAHRRVRSLQPAGNLATIGRTVAVADFGWLRLSGALAWWVWGVVHILFLSGMRNRVVVALECFWAYLTYRPSTRLITGDISFPTRSTAEG